MDSTRRHKVDGSLSLSACATKSTKGKGGRNARTGSSTITDKSKCEKRRTRPRVVVFPLKKSAAQIPGFVDTYYYYVLGGPNHDLLLQRHRRHDERKRNTHTREAILWDNSCQRCRYRLDSFFLTRPIIMGWQSIRDVGWWQKTNLENLLSRIFPHLPLSPKMNVTFWCPSQERKLFAPAIGWRESLVGTLFFFYAAWHFHRAWVRTTNLRRHDRAAFFS
jgi:hypothetical protein